LRIRKNKRRKAVNEKKQRVSSKFGFPKQKTGKLREEKSPEKASATGKVT